jgi:hypothetical protein
VLVSVREFVQRFCSLLAYDGKLREKLAMASVFLSRIYSDKGEDKKALKYGC